MKAELLQEDDGIDRMIFKGAFFYTQEILPSSLHKNSLLLWENCCMRSLCASAGFKVEISEVGAGFPRERGTGCTGI